MKSTRAIGPGEYRALYRHMQRDFPPGELPPYFAVRSSLKKGVYDAFFLTHEGEDAGYAVLTAPPGLSFALLNYFAVFPAMRAQGHGTAFLQMVIQRAGTRTLLLEAEAPWAAKTDEERALRTRRIEFYQRAGFHVVPTARARLFGVDMEIMITGGTVPHVRKTMHNLYLPAFGSKRWLRFIDVVDP